MISRNKKGQVTIFIVIGVILLLTAATYVILRVTKQEQPSEQAVISEVPVEFQPINDFVESCIAKTGKDAIKLLGFHGGYTDLNRYGIKANSAEPTEGRAFLFNSNDVKSGVAYWNYFKSDNQCETNCECSSEQPYLKKAEGAPNIEAELEDYVDKNLKICLLDFAAFEKQGFNINTIGDVKTTVTIRENDVLFLVNYKIEAKKGDSEFDIENFIKIVPVKLKKIYELANEIKEKELNFTYLERWTVEQLSGLGLGINGNKLPPIAASELSPSESPVYWIKEEVKNNIINNMLPVYTPFLSVFGTANYNNNLRGTFYERATVPLTSPSGLDYSDLDVKFNYLNWWPIYFDITGRGVSGQIIGPETASSSIFTFLGIKRYNFYYDVSYPILVDIYSPDAFNNEGVHFYFGLETNVRNNRPLNCSGPGQTRYAAPSGSMFCNYNQGCANITIETIDSKTGSPLANANVYYSSGGESCDKGFTELKGAKAIVETSLPQCVGTACSLNIVKDGYWTYPQAYAVRCDTSAICSNENVLCNGESLQLKMEPYRNTSIVLMKKKMLKQAQRTWVFNNAAYDLLDNEYAVITLEKIKSNPAEESLILSGIFYGNQTSMKFLPGLVPGNYASRIDLFYKFPDAEQREVVIFQEVEECEDVLGGLLGEECTTLGPYNFTDTIVEGGFVGNITLTKEMLDSNKNIIFYTLSVPDIDTSYDILDVYDLEELGRAENYSQTYKVELKPISG